MVGKMKNKRGQLKIQQMAFMLIAVTIFFAMVGLFLLAIKFSGMKEIATELEEKNARLLATKLANSPEFSCGEAFGTTKTNCIDADKLMMLKANIDKYSGFWGVSNIEIVKIYPTSSTGLMCGANYPDCYVIRLRPGDIKGYDASNFVTLCRKALDDENGEVYDKCELAKIMVSYEEK